MAIGKVSPLLRMALLLCFAAAFAAAQSFRVQCPASTITHPFPLTGTNCSSNPTAPGCNNSEPPYTGPTVFTTNSQGYVTPTANINGAIRCQQVSGGDGYSTMADGTQIFMFAFGPLSGLADIAGGLPGSEFPNVFNTPYPGTLVRGDPATSDGATSGGSPGVGVATGTVTPPFKWNGAVGVAPEVLQTINISDLVEGPLAAAPPATAPGCPAPTATTVTAYTFEPLGQPVGASIVIAGLTAANPTVTAPFAGYNGTYLITCVSNNAVAPSGFSQYAFQFTDPTAGLAVQSLLQGITASTPPQFDGHVDPRQIMDVGVMNGNIPAPLIAMDEDDEFFLTLSNVGMIMRPDLFEQHTIHWHGYPNASSFYDGVPDASVAINIGGSFTYYYLAPDAGTYFWHCHITPPEHLQMGMVGQLYVRPRQDRVRVGTSLYAALQEQNGQAPAQIAGTAPMDLRTACNPAADILCSEYTPAINTGAMQQVDPLVIDPATGVADLPDKYVFNDGDGSTQVDVEYPVQMHGFDPNFHFVGMTFNPEMFVDMKDKYFLLNGRSYPDTVEPGPQATVTSDGTMHYSQPLPAIINIPQGGRASLRLVNLSVAEYFTLQTLGIPMKVIGWNAKLLRDQAGYNTEYYTNSISLGGGESNDVMLDASDAGCGFSGCAAQLYPVGSVFYLYEPDLDRLSNDAENFGGMMTEVHICKTVTGSTFGNTCNLQ
jgi:FtsP/CotA-like multicopper oxidase with cupredoxin domain